MMLGTCGSNRRRDYSSAQKELSTDIRALNLDMKSTGAFLKRRSLTK
jgi:hypothetical protein